MARKRINSIYDLTAILKEAEKISSLLDKHAQQIEKMGTIKLNVQGEGSARKVSQAQTELSKSMQEFESIQKAIATSQAKLNTLNSESAKKLAELRLQQQEINKQNKEAAKDALGLNDAYAKLAKQYEQAARLAQNLVVAGKGNTEEAKKAIAVAQELGLKLREADASVLKFQRNVGNYANSLSDGFELVRREINRLKRDQEGLRIGGDTRGAEAAGRRIQELDNIIKVSFDNTKSFDHVVKSLQKSFSTMAADGNQSNEFLQDFKKFVAQAKDQAEDLKQEIKALSSDTRSLDLLAGGVSTLASTFEVASGASALLGANNEDVEKSLQQLVAIQSVANGVRELGKQITERGTLANKLYAFSQEQVAILTNVSATATQKFGAVLKLTAFGLIATAVGFIITQFSKLGSKSEELIDIQRSIEVVSKETAESFANEKVQLDLLIKEYTRSNTTQERRKEIFDELQRKYPTYFGYLNQEKATVEEILNVYNRLSRALLLRARISAATSELAKNEAKAIQLAINLGIDDIDKLEEVAKRFLESGNSGLVSDIFKQQISEFLTARKALNSIIIKSQDELNAIGGDPGATSGGDKRIKATREQAEKIKENERQLVADIFSINKSGSELLKDELDRRLEANKEAYETLLGQAEKYKNDQLAANQQGFNAAITSVEDYNKRREAIEREFQLKTLSTQISFLETQVKLLKSFGQDVTQLEATIAEAKRKLFELKSTNNTGGNTDEQVSELVGFLTKAEKRFSEFATFTGGLSRAIADREKNRLQEQIDQIEENKRREIDLVNASGDSEERKAARIKVIEAKAQADRDVLEKKKREAAYKSAAYEKALTITQIIITNALNVAKAISKGPGAVIAAIAFGLGQLAVAIATPIPKFFRGKKKNDPYQGLGWVGDQGREIGIDTVGRLTMYEKPTLTYLRKGDVILPNSVTEDIIRSASGGPKVMAMSVNSGNKGIDGSKINKMIGLLESINGKRSKGQVVVHNHIHNDLTPYYYYHMKQ